MAWQGRGGGREASPGRSSASGPNRRLKGGQSMSALPGISDINLFRYCWGIIDLDAEIPDRAFDLGMPEQELDSPQVARSPVDQGSFAAQGMRPELPRVESDAANPLGDEAGILAGCYAAVGSAMAGEQKLAGPFARGV